MGVPMEESYSVMHVRLTAVISCFRRDDELEIEKGKNTPITYIDI